MRRERDSRTFPVCSAPSIPGTIVYSADTNRWPLGGRMITSILRGPVAQYAFSGPALSPALQPY